MLRKLIHARLFLGLYVLRHAAMMLVPGARSRRGAGRFRECYFPEGLAPVTPRLRELLPGSEACVGCDLCLAAEVPRGRLSPRDLALRVARSSNAWSRVIPLLADEESYRAAEPLCPARVPFASLAAAIRESAPR